MNLVFCTHIHAAATSGTTGHAGGLSTDNVIAIVVGTTVVILGIVATIPGIIAGVYKFRKWWKNKENERSNNSSGSLVPDLSCCW